MGQPGNLVPVHRNKDVFAMMSFQVFFFFSFFSEGIVELDTYVIQLNRYIAVNSK